MADPEKATHDEAETRRHLEGYLGAYPGLRGRVCRILLLHLHSEGHVRIEDVYRRAQRAEEWNIPTDPNVPSSRLWAADERELINAIVIDLAAKHLSPRRVDEIVWAAHRRDEAQSLEALSRMTDVPIELIAEKVGQFASLVTGKDGTPRIDTPVGTKVALIRRFISGRVDYISIAKNYLRIRDIDWVLQRCIGSEHGQGVVGGKAAGMVLAASVLNADPECGPVKIPETVFVLTDAYDEFKQINGMGHLQDHKYKSIEEVRADFRAIGEIFRNAEFPPRVADLLRIELDRWGEVPLIVRSSSVLEDNFGATFSGIYRSLFLLNQGPLEERLRALLAAISEIYSGVFSPDAISYRRRHDLIDYDERMGAMIQPVVGSRYGDYYLPSLAGVLFSRNDYRWNTRIRREDGLARLVVGLGTHAVDRVADCARMVALALPTMRPEGTAEEIVAASQRNADVVDLRGPGFTQIPVSELLEAMQDENIGDYVSILEDHRRLAVPVGSRVHGDPSKLCVTFERFLSRGEFPRRARRILGCLEAAYRTPVDIEFAVNGSDFYILQCRPLGGETRSKGPPIPNVPMDDRVFSASRYVNNGHLESIDYVVLVDPTAYMSLTSVDRRLEVAHAVGRVNDALAHDAFVLVGPGRWGSQDIRLGVQVNYADIANARALIEVARIKHGYTTEPSFGTHFFQDLVEADILYLPLYPDEKAAIYNEDFLLHSPNALARVSPSDAHLESVLRVIKVADARPGRALALIMDGETQQALCFLK